MAYADGFLLPVATKNLAAYRKVSEAAGKIWMEHGALDYKECAGDDLFVKGMTANFPATLKAKKGETVVFSWILYRDRAHRDAVNAKVMADPRMDAMMKSGKPMPFDVARMNYGGFEAFVDLAPQAAPRRARKAKAAPKKTAKKKKMRR